MKHLEKMKIENESFLRARTSRAVVTRMCHVVTKASGTYGMNTSANGIITTYFSEIELLVIRGFRNTYPDRTVRERAIKE
jgi:hypothetical protein